MNLKTNILYQLMAVKCLFFVCLWACLHICRDKWDTRLAEASLTARTVRPSVAEGGRGGSPRSLPCPTERAICAREPHAEDLAMYAMPCDSKTHKHITYTSAISLFTESFCQPSCHSPSNRAKMITGKLYITLFWCMGHRSHLPN